MRLGCEWRHARKRWAGNFGDFWKRSSLRFEPGRGQARYKLSKSQKKINHIMYMDDIKLFSNIKKELEILIHAVKIYSQDIEMEFGFEKCAMLVMKSGKQHLTDIVKQPNQDKIRTLEEKENYKYLGILEAYTIKPVEMKERIKNEYLSRTRKLLDTKLCCRNRIKRINTWVVHLVRYSGLFLKWTGEELKQMYQRTRKLMIMHKALHSRDDVDYIYQEKKEEEDSLALKTALTHPCKGSKTT